MTEGWKWTSCPIHTTSSTQSTVYWIVPRWYDRSEKRANIYRVLG